MYPLHPHIASAFNQSHIEDLRRRPAARASRRAPGPARQATGWFLVRVGMRLAVPAPRLIPVAR